LKKGGISMGDNMSPADVAAVVGNTDRNYGYPYPVYGGGFGNSGFGGDSSWLWLIIILALFGRMGRKWQWWIRKWL
jgi:hypothetical protein